MKKYTKIIFILILSLILILCAYMIYRFFNNKEQSTNDPTNMQYIPNKDLNNNKTSDNNTNNSNQIDLNDDDQNNNTSSKIVTLTKTYKVLLSNETLDIPIKYISVIGEDSIGNYESRYIYGELDGVMLFIDCGNVNNMHIINSKQDLEKEVNKLETNNYFSNDNFRVIKGTDNKEYIVIRAFEESDATVAYHYYVYNNDLKCLNSDAGIVIEYYGGGFAFDDNNYTYDLDFTVPKDIDASDFQIRAKIVDNSIYALYWTTSDEDIDKNYLEERVYRIANNKFTYTLTGRRVYFHDAAGVFPANYPE